MCRRMVLVGMRLRQSKTSPPKRTLRAQLRQLSDTADPANDEAAPVVVAPDVDAVMEATHVAQVVGDAVHLPMITIKLDDRALAPAAPLVQVPYLEKLLDAVRAGTPLVQLPSVVASAAGQAHQDLATFITELVVSLFDPVAPRASGAAGVLPGAR